MTQLSVETQIPETAMVLAGETPITIYTEDENFYEGVKKQIPYMAYNSRDYRGKIVNVLTGEAYDKIEFQILAQKQTRVCFNPDIKGKPRLFCRSADFEHGLLNEEELKKDNSKAYQELIRMGVGRKCLNCPLSEWTRDEKGENKPPLCSEQRIIMARLVDSNQLVALQFRRTGLKPINRILSAFASIMVTVEKVIDGQNVKVIKPIAPYAKTVKMELDHKTDPFDYYVPKFVVGDFAPSDWITSAAQARQEFRDDFYAEVKAAPASELQENNVVQVDENGEIITSEE